MTPIALRKTDKGLFQDSALFLAAFAFSASCIAIAFVLFHGRHPIPTSSRLSLNAHDILGDTTGFRGKPWARFTLVEFSDYECFPCKSLAPSINKMVSDHPDLRLDVHYLPLTMHQHSREAALAAAAAKEQGKFWQVHDKLMEEPVMTSAAIKKILLSSGVKPSSDNTVTSMAVERDIALARKLGLSQTPTLLLCNPDGSAIRVTNLSQIGDLLANHPKKFQ